MSETVIGVVHPGEMGAAIAADLTGRGYQVLWAAAGRSESTRRRAKEAGLVDVGDVDELAARSDVVLSIVPPHTALEVAASLAGKVKVYVDANAISPSTTREVGELIEGAGGSFVDGGIVGPPPRSAGKTRLYLSGAGADDVSALFAGGLVGAPVLAGGVGAASALKMTYAAWTKGTDALLLAILAVATAHDVDEALCDEWRISKAPLLERLHNAGWAAGRKGWRWTGEMEEIAATFEAAGLPGGFHHAAAEIFSRSPRDDEAERDDAAVRNVVTALLHP